LLFPRSDAAALRINLERLLADNRLRAEYGRHSRQEYERLFRAESMLAATFQVYDRILS
jgi:glycosyltransferase involved in cell wall biosynthesis